MASSTPLAGMTVIEVGHSFAAPYAGLILSELGATVVKVENPKGGDYARGWGPPFWGQDATCFHALNHGKQSLSVDFGDEAQTRALRELIVERADIVIQNLRAGTAQRYGLDAERLLADKPGLIYCDIGAYGQSGPLADKPGYDPLMQAGAGIMSVTGEGGERPPVRVGVSLVDLGAGMWSTIGILSALLDRARTGRGGHVATSLYEAALAWMTVPMASFAADGKIRRPHGSGIAEIVPYQCFMTRGGWLMVAAGNDNLFRKLCATLGRPAMADDERYATNSARVIHREALVPELESLVREWEIDALMAALDEKGVPNAALQNVAQVAAHPQTDAVGILQQPEPGALRMVGLPLTFDSARPYKAGNAPALGQHNEAVLGAAPPATMEK